MASDRCFNLKAAFKIRLTLKISGGQESESKERELLDPTAAS